MFVQAVNTVDDMERLPNSSVSDGEYLFVGGYHKRGDGGGGMFVLDVNSGAEKDRGLVFDTHSSLGTDARWLRLDMGLGFISVKWFGAKGDGIQDDLPAFEAAMKALEPVPEPPSNHKSRGGAIVVPRSYPHYLIRGNLIINRAIHLYGELGNARFPATALLFEDCERNEDGSCKTNKDEEIIPRPAGIIIKPPINEHDRVRGTYTILRDLYIIAGEGNEANGIHMKSRATLERVRVRKFGGHGVFIDGRDGQGDIRNSNLWRIRDCHFENNGKCGLYIDGQETNAGLSEGLAVEANGEWGIFDSTFLGSTHVAPFADFNIAGAYKNGSARAGTGISTPKAVKAALEETRGRAGKSTWINPYVEGQSPVELFDLTVIVGGIGGIDPIVRDNPFYSLPARGPILEVTSIRGSGGSRDIFLAEWNSELCIAGKRLDVYNPVEIRPRNVDFFTVDSIDFGSRRITLSGVPSDLSLITVGDSFAPRGEPRPPDDPVGVPDAWWFGRVGRQLALRLGYRNLVTGFLATDILGSEKLKVAVAYARNQILRMQRTGDGHEWAIVAKDGHYWLMPDNSTQKALLEWGTAHATQNRQHTLRFPNGFYLGPFANPSKIFMISSADIDPSTGRPKANGEHVGDRAYLQDARPGKPFGWIWIESPLGSGIHEWKILGTIES
jgi:hypothetical protein